MDINAEQDPVKWGPHTWATLHRFAIQADKKNDLDTFNSFLTSMETLLPCSACRSDFVAYIKYSRPKPGNIFEWTVDLHNSVNKKLNKPILTVEESRSIWLSDSCSYSCASANKKDKKKVPKTVIFCLILLFLAIILFVVQWRALRKSSLS